MSIQAYYPNVTPEPPIVFESIHFHMLHSSIRSHLRTFAKADFGIEYGKLISVNFLRSSADWDELYTIIDNFLDEHFAENPILQKLRLKGKQTFHIEEFSEHEDLVFIVGNAQDRKNLAGTAIAIR